MSKGGRKQTVTQTNTQTLDPQSQAFVNAMRQQAQTGAGAILNGGPLFTGPIQQTPGEMAQGFMSPYIANVIGGLRGEFDHLRSQALTGSNQQATQAGAFGGSRAAIMAGARMGELDRAQASQVAGLLNSGFQNAMGQGLDFAKYQQGLAQQAAMEPLFRQQQAMQLMNMGMGPVGFNTTSTTTQPRQGNFLGGAAGGALTALGAGLTGGVPLAIGAGLGALGGLFG